MHVRTAAVIIGILRGAMAFLFFLDFWSVMAKLSGEISQQDENMESRIVWLEVPYLNGFADVLWLSYCALLFVGSAIACPCVFLAVCKNRPRFLVPEMLVMLASVPNFVLTMVFFMFVLATGWYSLGNDIWEPNILSNVDSNERVNFLTKLLATAAVVVHLIAIVLTCWFYCVIRQFYRYLQNLRDNDRSSVIVDVF